MKPVNMKLFKDRVMEKHSKLFFQKHQKHYEQGYRIFMFLGHSPYPILNQNKRVVNMSIWGSLGYAVSDRFFGIGSQEY